MKTPAMDTTSVVVLWLDTSNNCSENMPANDWSEHWMKTVSGRKGDQQEQLCQIDLGNQCYVVGKLFKGQMFIHVRRYDRRDDGTLFPTKKGIALNLEKWKKLQYCFLENVDSAVGQYQDSKPVDLFIHLGGNYHVSVKSGYPLVSIRRWFVPEGQETLTPTKAGIALTFLTVGETKIGYAVSRRTFERWTGQCKFLWGISSESNRGSGMFKLQTPMTLWTIEKEWHISAFTNICLFFICFYPYKHCVLLADIDNSADSNQTLQKVASDQGLIWLLSEGSINIWIKLKLPTGKPIKWKWTSPKMWRVWNSILA